jgi:hypothetical protein
MHLWPDRADVQQLEEPRGGEALRRVYAGRRNGIRRVGVNLESTPGFNDHPAAMPAMLLKPFRLD